MLFTFGNAILSATAASNFRTEFKLLAEAERAKPARLRGEGAALPDVV